MLNVNSVAEVEGKWINEFVKVLTKPRFENNRWTALAIAYGALCLVELTVTQKEI